MDGFVYSPPRVIKGIKDIRTIDMYVDLSLFNGIVIHKKWYRAMSELVNSWSWIGYIVSTK